MKGKRKMLNLLELEQLSAFAEYGTLSKAAEKLNISQPTITRTMQHLEEEFGVSDASAKSLDPQGRYTDLEMYLHYLVRDIIAAQNSGAVYTAL